MKDSSVGAASLWERRFAAISLWERRLAAISLWERRLAAIFSTDVRGSDNRVAHPCALPRYTARPVHNRGETPLPQAH